MRTSLFSFALILGVVANLHAEELTVKSVAPATQQVFLSEKANSVAKAWPFENSDVKPDPNITWGKLDNGLRYVVIPTAALPTRASLRLYMDVGSLMEDKDQRGMAHFLEHLAFCGSKHFPPGDAIETLQRLGMKFGADSNAFTSYDKTVYQLELPSASGEVMQEGCSLLRDFLDGMLLDAKEIDRERGVILSEILARDSAESRAGKAALQYMLPDSLIAQRDVLGTVADIQNLTRKRFVDFYETWYTPARAVIVAAGDFDKNLVERMIEKDFADVVARRGEQPTPAMGKIDRNQNIAAKFFKNADLQTTVVRLEMVAPAANVPDTISRERQLLSQVVANSIINVRLNKIVTNQTAPIGSAGASTEQLLRFAEMNSIAASSQPDKWKESLGVVEQELRRALMYGFSDQEFDDFKKEFTSFYQARVDQAATRQPSALAELVIDSLADNEVFTHPVDDLAFLKSFFTEVTKQDCENALRKAWIGSDLKIWVQGNLSLDGDSQQQILDAFRASAQTPVAHPNDDTNAKWAYADFGPAGTIVKHNDQKDLNVVEAVFDNNVRVNIKHTDYEKGKAAVVIRFGGGLLELPADKPGLDSLAAGIFISGGLKAHTLTEINRILADKMWMLRFIVSDDAFVLGGACASTSLETELQAAAAYLTAPGFRPEAVKEFHEGLDSYYAGLDHTAEGAEYKGLASLLHNDDPRFSVPSHQTLEKLTLDDVETWLADPLAKGYMEVTIVGDIDPDQTMKLVSQTLGALPKRDAAKPDYANQRQVKFPIGKKQTEIHFTSEGTRAISVVCWPTGGSRDTSLQHRTRVLADILADRLRLKVRTQLGATYSPEAFRHISEAFPDYGYIQAEMTVDPQRVGEIGPVVAGIGSDLAKGEISDDEFARAIKPVLASLEDSAKNNGSGLGWLNNCQE
ncbi:MAG TPA: insulinase family protein, partial [Pirellulales bacterium]